MARVPWLRILDMLIGVSDLARGGRGRPTLEAESASQQLAPGSRALGHLETRLAGVVVAALREAFDRDTHRLELERQQVEAERAHAERALRLELLRQAGDREIGRLRLVAAVAVASWIGTLFFSARLMDAGAGTRALLGGGWALLLGALAAAFLAQANVGAALGRIDETNVDQRPVEPGFAGTLAPWLIVIGLALVGVSVLIA